MLTVHWVHSGFVEERTPSANRARGLLPELGTVLPHKHVRYQWTWGSAVRIVFARLTEQLSRKILLQSTRDESALQVRQPWPTVRGVRLPATAYPALVAAHPIFFKV
jgi:hypothetical protein